MTGTFIVAWGAFPLLLLAIAAGNGLLVRRLSGGSLSPTLAVPVGFALTIALCAIGTSIAWLAPATGAIAVAFAVAGFVVERWRGGLRWRVDRRVPWGALAGLAGLAVIAAPVVLSGTPTWTGYTRIVDTGFQMDFARYLADAGRAAVGNDSSYHNVIQKLLPEGYPGGSQGSLGALSTLIHLDVPWAYQPFLAFASATGAVSIYSLLGRITDSGLLRVVGAATAIQANLLYAYALEGGIKELTTAVLLILIVALLVERLPGDAGPRAAVLPLAVAFAGAVATFSFGIAPWLGILFAGLFVVTVVRPGRRLRAVQDWVLFGVLGLVLALPSLITSIRLAGIAGAAVGGVVDLGLGNLAAPVPDWSGAGIWLTADYRYPLSHVTATHALDTLVISLGVIGLAWSLWRRKWAIGLLGLGTPLALYYWIAHSGPWIQFKAFTITGLFTLVLAFVGVAVLRRTPLPGARLVSWLVCAIVSGGVLYGNALTYHDISLAPAARYRDLAAIGNRYAGQSPLLYPAFDEYAEYFLRRERETDTLNPAGGVFTLRPGVPEPGGIGFLFDLNQLVPTFVQSFPLIVEPRSPIASRAPANFDLIRQTRYFEVWRRARPASAVVAHLPLSGLPHERSARFCQSLVGLVRRAGAGALVAYSQPTAVAAAATVLAQHPRYWLASGDSLRARGAGNLSTVISVSAPATYKLWMRGSVGRPLRFAIDGHSVGHIAYEERYPGQWLAVGTVALGAGSHTVRVTRGNGSLHPGSGDGIDTISGDLGPLVLTPARIPYHPIQVTPGSGAQSICRAQVGYSWIEVLRPAAVPPDAVHVAF